MLMLQQFARPLGKKAFGGLQLGLRTKLALVDHGVDLTLFVFELLPEVLEDLGDDETLVPVLVLKVTLPRSELFQHALKLIGTGHAVLQ